MGNEQDNSQTADNATATESVAPLAEELGPMGPPAGDDSDEVESSLILDTFFGDGTAEVSNSGSGQGKGSNESDGQSQGSLAPPKAASAANGEGDSPSPGSSSTQQTATTSNGGEGTAAQTPGQGQQPSSEPGTSPQTELSVEDRLRLANANALAEQNRQLIERLQRLENGQKPQDQGQGQTPTSSQPGADEQPLRLAVPDNLYNGIFSEDEATSKQSLNLLISAVAHNAMQAALAKVGPLVDQKLQGVTQTLEASKQQEGMEEAYFGRYPAHKNELFRPLIQSVVQEKYQQFPHAAWDETMMDAVGATVNAKLKALGVDPSAMASSSASAAGSDQNGQGQQQEKGKDASQPKPKPAPMLDTSNRGGVPSDAGDFIAATFG